VIVVNEDAALNAAPLRDFSGAKLGAGYLGTPYGVSLLSRREAEPETPTVYDDIYAIIHCAALLRWTPCR
jgi:hypothetical protein